MSSIVVDGERLVGANAVANNYETVVVESRAEKNDISGTFQLHMGDQSTSALGYDISESDMQTALELLDRIGASACTKSFRRHPCRDL